MTALLQPDENGDEMVASLLPFAARGRECAQRDVDADPLRAVRDVVSLHGLQDRDGEDRDEPDVHLRAARAGVAALSPMSGQRKLSTIGGVANRPGMEDYPVAPPRPLTLCGRG